MTMQERKPLHVFAGFLCAARNQRGMTQQEAADFIRRSKRWYQRIEAGTSRPNWQDALLLAALFQLDTAAFAEEVGFPVPVSSH
ncbi:helix-turn-helix transcriptional regulator [uncultured Oscillibacter sp.]|uniref:helix-turn-helix domain-containing protein n=1 Tax=uncultured Oscillibacter sp. TaxID=876091 RepID=UPI0025D3B544|nr:helix-turn-helix transcriptional regulator [uncultured Oscillibacter sp.]